MPWKDGGHAEILEIGQVIDDALEVAAMVVTRLLPVEQTARHGRVVIGGIAVSESVRHDQVDDVVGREALKAAGARQRLQHFEGRGGLAAGRNALEKRATA